ncbi:hypothetical protein LCGC14_1816210, partial [marine sediment metagenome]
MSGKMKKKTFSELLGIDEADKVIIE